MEKNIPGEGFNYSFWMSQSPGCMTRKRKQPGWRICHDITIFISCMGLFGLAMFTAERRTKEIGIRKVLESSVPILLLCWVGFFVRLIMIAILMRLLLPGILWTNGCRILLIVSISSLGICALPLNSCIDRAAYRKLPAVKAAVADPVKSLRTEWGKKEQPQKRPALLCIYEKKPCVHISTCWLKTIN